MRKKLQLSSAEITGITKSNVSEAHHIELEYGYECKLVGPFSRCLFLLYGKNVGSPSQYILTAENATRYLSELKEGSKILSVNSKGEMRQAIVKENDIKDMQCILVDAKCKEVIVNKNLPYYNPSDVKLFVQDSDGSWLVKKDGKPISIQNLETGMEVLVFLGLYGYGRHFGVGVESIELIEK